MKLEDQVCSLELAKRLKELWVKQESVFYWFKGYEDWLIHYINYNHSEEDIKVFLNNVEGEAYSAFTVAELGVLLKCGLSSCLLYKCDELKEITIFSPYYNIRMSDATEANARAKMLIYLLENGLMKSGETK